MAVIGSYKEVTRKLTRFASGVKRKFNHLYNGSIVLKRKRVSRIFLPIYLSYNK